MTEQSAMAVQPDRFHGVFFRPSGVPGLSCGRTETHFCRNAAPPVHLPRAAQRVGNALDLASEQRHHAEMTTETVLWCP
jgi:hypothetical protein